MNNLKNSAEMLCVSEQNWHTPFEFPCFVSCSQEILYPTKYIGNFLFDVIAIVCLHVKDIAVDRVI